MLKYKKHTFASIADGIEDLTDILAGQSGKNRKVVSIAGEKTADQYLRAYKDADQVVDIPSATLTTTHPFLTLDIPLAEGELFKVGYYNNTGGAVTTQEIIIGYEETA